MLNAFDKDNIGDKCLNFLNLFVGFAPTKLSKFFFNLKNGNFFSNSETSFLILSYSASDIKVLS